MKRTIPSYPEYQVTKDGQVFKGGQLIKTLVKGSVRVSINRRLRLVSELVAEAWLDKPENAIKVIYKDGNNLNITADNLMWVSENYPEINEPIIYYNGSKFCHLSHLETKQYYLDQSGRILNFISKRIMKCAIDSIGYVRFSYYFSKDAKLCKRTIAVHILVYQVFKGLYDQNQFEINHIDGNKLNNHISNLEILSHQENMNHARKSNLQKSKYPNAVIEKIINMVRDGESWLVIHSEFLSPELELTKVQSYSLINAVVHNRSAYTEICQTHGFIKGSTTRTKVRTS